MRKPPYQILFIALATALVLPGDAILYAVLPTYYPQIGLTPIEVGILLSANRWVRLISNHIAERTLHRFRGEPWLVAAFLTGSAVMVVYAAANLFWVLLAARIAWGVSFSFQRQAGIMTVMRASQGVDLRQQVGYLRGFTALGGIVGVLLGGMGHDLFGFTPTLLGFCALSLAAAPLAVLSQRGLGAARGVTVKAGTGRLSLGLMLCGLMVGMVGPGLVSSTLGLVLAERMGGTLQLAGLTVGVATLSGVMLAFRWTMDGVGSPLLGALADRVGRERFAAPVFLLGALALSLAGLSSGLAGVLAGVPLLFFCGTFLGVLLTARAGMLGSRAVAAYVTAQDFGSALGPIIGWSIAQGGGAPRLIFLAGAACYLLAMLAARRHL